MRDATLTLNMQRRTLLKLGIGSAAVLALAGGGLSLLGGGLTPQGRLAAGARDVMRAIARAVLDGLLPAEPAPLQIALDEHLARLDAAVMAFPAATRQELSQLLALLAHAPGRIALTAMTTSWNDATPDQLSNAMQALRQSSVSLRQQAYHALRDLTNAAWFADRHQWAALGYDGPVAV